MAKTDDKETKPSGGVVQQLAAKKRRRFVGVLLGILAGAAVGVVALVASAAGGLPEKPPIPEPKPDPAPKPKPDPAPKPNPKPKPDPAPKPGPKPSKPPKPDPDAPPCNDFNDCAQDEVCYEGKCVPIPPGDVDPMCVTGCVELDGKTPEECVKECKPGGDPEEPCPEKQMLLGGPAPMVLSVRTCKPDDEPGGLPQCWAAEITKAENSGAREFVAGPMEANEPIDMMSQAGYAHPGGELNYDSFKYYALAAIRWVQAQRQVWSPLFQVDGELASSWRYWPGTQAFMADKANPVILPKDAAVIECVFGSPTITQLIEDVELDLEELLA